MPADILDATVIRVLKEVVKNRHRPSIYKKARAKRDRTWGFEGDTLWVDRGLRATFRVTLRPKREPTSDLRDKQQLGEERRFRSKGKMTGLKRLQIFLRTVAANGWLGKEELGVRCCAIIECRPSDRHGQSKKKYLVVENLLFFKRKSRKPAFVKFCKLQMITFALLDQTKVVLFS